MRKNVVLNTILSAALALSFSPFGTVAAYADPVEGNGPGQSGNPHDNDPKPDDPQNPTDDPQNPTGNPEEPQGPTIEVLKSDDVTITITWNDSNDTEQGRPSVSKYNENGYGKLYYMIDDEWVELTAESAANIGLSGDDATAAAAISVPEEQPSTIKWSYTKNLPSSIKVTEGEDEPVTKSVSYKYVQQRINDSEDFEKNYIAPLQSEDDLLSVTNCLQSDYKATVTWQDPSDPEHRPTVSTVTSSFTVARFLSGEDPNTATAVEGASVSFEGTDTSEWTTYIAADEDGLPRYDEKGNEYVYVVKYPTEKDELLTPEEGGDSEAYYDPVVRNDGNYALETGVLFSKGNLTETITGVTSYKAEKVWKDDNSTSRPNCTVYMYRVVSTDDIDSASPVQGYDKAKVPTESNSAIITIGEDADGNKLLPKYSASGERYIYFTIESNPGGDYKRIVDYSVDTCVEPDEVKAAFNKAGVNKYILNGAKLTNILKDQAAPSVTKTFKAAAIQSQLGNLTSTFTLQTRKVGAKEWADYESNGDAVTVDVSGFMPEVTSITTAPAELVEQYDENGAKLEYRWIETSISVKSGESTQTYEIPITNRSADFGTSEDSLTYGTVSIPGLLPSNATSTFQPSQSSNFVTVNTLQADHYMHTIKNWVGEDSDDFDGVYVEFTLTRNGKKIGTVTLTPNNAKTTFTPEEGFEGIETTDVATGNINQDIFDLKLPRFDEDGEEYAYSLTETKLFDPKNYWAADPYPTRSKNTRTEDDKICTQDNTTFNNTHGDGGRVLIFEVYKDWNDGSDLSSRKPVVASLYEVNADDTVGNKCAGEKSSVTLSADNNWYGLLVFTLEDGDDRNYGDFVVKEDTCGTAAVDYSGHTVSGDYRYGVAQFDLKGAGSDLSYNYKTTIKSENGFKNYVITNTRVATLDVSIKKEWKTGSVAPDATFQLQWKNTATGEWENIEGKTCTLSKPSDNPIVAFFSSNSDSYTFENLDKYDAKGELISYRVVETSISLNEETAKISKGTATLNGDKYTASVSQCELSTSAADKDNADKSWIAGAEDLHSGDHYRYKGVNSRTDSYDLNVNLVWRDDGTAKNTVARPDVSFTIYRVSAKELGISDDDATDTSALVSTLAASYMDSAHVYKSDKIWNTEHNDYYWSCDCGNVARYDSEGYRYIYFVAEKFNSGQGIYVKSYDNYYSDAVGGGEHVNTPNGTSKPASTKEVLNCPTDELYDASFVAIVSDGKANGEVKASEAYSRTVVNYRVDTRNVSIRKTWTIADGWGITASSMPEVQVDLYQLDEPIVDAQGKTKNVVTLEEIKERLGSDPTSCATTALNNSNRFMANIETDNDGNKLRRYNEWGESYFYYVQEIVKGDGYQKAYPPANASLNLTSNLLNNAYKPSGEKVKVQSSKTWANIRVESMDQLAPATFRLYAQATDGNGNLVGNKMLVATKTVYPESKVSENTYKANVSFDTWTTTTYKDSILPYLGPNGNPLAYWITEDAIPGYITTNPGAGHTSASPIKLTKNAEGVWTGQTTDGAENAQAQGFTNTYDDDEGYKVTVDITLAKEWPTTTLIDKTTIADPPDKIQVTLQRSWPAYTVNGKRFEAGADYVCIDNHGNYGFIDDEDTWLTIHKEAGNTWTYTIKEQLPKYNSAGKAYTYKIVAEKGYDKNYFNSKVNSNTRVVNTYKTTSISASKTWKSKNTGSALTNNDLKRAVATGAIPDTLFLMVQRRVKNTNDNWEYIEANDKASAGTTTAFNGTKLVGVKFDVANTSSTNFKYTWDKKLPTMKTSTEEYEYRVVEAVKWGSDDVIMVSENASISRSSNWEFDPIDAVVNGYNWTNNVENTTFTAKKIWDDDSDRDGLRTKMVAKYQLLSDGTAFGDPVTIGTSKNDDSYTWNYLPKYKYNNGEKSSIVYSVDELNKDTNKYTTTIADGKTITNKHIPETINIAVEKAWEENNTNNNKTVTFTVTGKVDDKTVDIKPGKTSETITVTADGNWKAEAQGFYRYYDHGKTINYTVTESPLPGYKPVYSNVAISTDESGKATYTFAVENKFDDTTKISKELKKFWNDEDDFDNKRPTSVDFKLVGKVGDQVVYPQNGVEATVTLKSSENWAKTVRELPKYYKGKEIAYSVSEPSVPTDYTISKSTDLTITNKHVPETVDVKVAKVWDDDSNRDCKRTDSVTVKLTADGKDVAGATSIVLNAANNWSWTSDGKGLELRKNKNVGGKASAVAYSFVEVNVPADYNATTSGNMEDGFTITNKHVPETVNVDVKKVWSDDDNRDAIRTASVTVKLTADGATVKEGIVLNKDNSWSWKSTEDSSLTLKKYKNVDGVATPIEYKFVETAVDGYETAYTGTIEDGFTVTNTHIPATVNVEVEKAWNDDNNRDAIRTGSVTVKLTADGEDVKGAERIVLNKGNNWKWKSKDTDLVLKKYKNVDGKAVEIEYAFQEVTVPTGYKDSVIGDIEKGFLITNTHSPDTINVSVAKVWDDDDNRDCLRTDSVTVKLTADGEAVKGADNIVLNAENSWSWSSNGVEGLTLYKNKNVDDKAVQIVYAFEEVSVPEDYTVSYDGSIEKGFTVTNTHTPATVTVNVNKVWDDDDNRDCLRTDSATVKLTADGEDVKGAEEIVLNKDNDWMWDSKDTELVLKKYKNVDNVATEIVYAFEEVEVPEGYTVSYNGSIEDGFTVTNTHAPETIVVKVKKVWNDNKNHDGKRPESVIVKLLGDGEAVKGAENIVLDDSNSWYWTSAGKDVIVNKYKNVDDEAVEIAYTFEEVKVPADYTVDYTGTAVEGTTITNTHEDETVTVSVEKVWNDSDDGDMVRPDSVTVKLTADGKKVKDAGEIVLSKKNKWSWSSEKAGITLPKYKRSGGVSTKIEYSFEEVEVPLYYTAKTTGSIKKGFTITNTHKLGDWSDVRGAGHNPNEDDNGSNGAYDKTGRNMVLWYLATASLIAAGLFLSFTALASRRRGKHSK